VKNHGDFIADRLKKVGSEIYLLGPDEYSAFLKKNYQLFREVLKVWVNRPKRCIKF
jgi:hypothetical protein